MKEETLAINGGDPLRKEPYPIHTTKIDQKEIDLVVDVLNQGHLSGFSARPGERFLGGKRVIELEELFAKKFHVKHAVSFNSATSGIHGAMAAIGISPGDEVITSPFTMSATASAIVMQNGVPIFADIEEETFGLDPKSVEALITERTKAILAVNIFGHPAKLDELQSIAIKHNLKLIEDNAQSPLAHLGSSLAGTIGDIGILSLNYHKCIQTGEGGMVLTDNDDYASHLRLFRNHGEVIVGKIGLDEMSNQLGYNYRLGEVLAAIGIGQLSKFDMLTKHRVELAQELTKLLSEFNFLIPPHVRENSSHVYYLFPIRFISSMVPFTRDEFVAAMKAEGIALNAGYVQPIYLEPMYQNRSQQIIGCSFNCGSYSGSPNYKLGACQVAERIHFEEICITDICKYPNSLDEIHEFVSAVRKVQNGLTN
jgi:dTDP-4-amino-4,6-dideoxygalactose transaminase